jgi:uncharacterized protein (TIGR03435 family)
MRLQIVRTVSCVALTFVAAGILRAQVEQARSFEVASVRLTDRRTPPSRRYTNTRVDLTNISLHVLLLRAFQIDRPSQLSAPDWVRDVNVEIHAVIPDGSGLEHIPEMMRTLLFSRFSLRVHTEPRPTDVYELVVGGGGVRIQEVQAVNELDKKFPAEPSRKAPLLDQTSDGPEGGLRSIFTDRGLIIITDRSMYETMRTNRGTYQINAARMTMGQLAPYLAATVDRPVVDGTKLTGLYKFQIDLPPPTFAPGLLASLGVSTTPDGTPINDPSGISAFKAVEELGLKLEPRRIPLDTIVVDKIERAPTEN